MIVELSEVAEHSWRLLAERIASETDERTRRNLEVVARHVREEVRGDVPALMATLVPQPHYEVWGASESVGPKGYEEVERFYESAIAIGKNRLEFEIDRVVADAEAVITEGAFRHACSGELLLSRGLGTPDEIEPAGWYLVEYRALIVWPVNADGLIEGEQMYAGERPRVVRRLAPGECVHLGPRDR